VDVRNVLKQVVSYLGWSDGALPDWASSRTLDHTPRDDW